MTYFELHVMNIGTSALDVRSELQLSNPNAAYHL